MAKKRKRQTINRAQNKHGTRKNDQHETHQKLGLIAGAPEVQPR